MWVCLLAMFALGQRTAAQALDASISNAAIQAGVSQAYGGGIVWLSTSGGTNLVNNHDRGRQIQQSYYAGNSITASNQSSSWSPWPWNPIMVGDYAGHASPVLVLANHAGQIYVKTQPLLWDRNNQLSQSYMEQWISLHPTLPNVVVVDNRFTCFRDPNDPWGGPVLRDQELPAVYFVSALNTIKAYTNNLPWADEPLVTIPNTPASGSFPWVRYTPTEEWTACISTTGFGAGVYTPVATNFLAGKYGAGSTWNTFDSSTMYIAPLGRYAFDTNSVFCYRYYLIVGDLSTIRSNVYTLHAVPGTPPLPPTGLTASSGNRQISLTWNPSPDTTAYNIYYSTTTGGPYALVASVTTTDYTHTGLANGMKYYYTVSASNSVGEGAIAPEVSATPTNIVIIPVPNFGFETPAIATYQYAPIAGASWTLTGGSGISRNGSAFTSKNPPAPEGAQVGLLQGTGGTISQLLTGFPVAARCTVTFAAAQRVTPINGGQTWDVTINGTVIGSFAPPPAATNYVDYTVTFTATAGSNTLAFVGTNLNGGDNTVFLDDVRVHCVPPPVLDTDEDGLPDEWETANGLDPNDPNDADWDGDGDGFTSQQEYWAGTHPMHSASALRVTALLISNGNFHVCFTSAVGRFYDVEHNLNLTATNGWSAFTNNVPGTGAPVEVVDPGVGALPGCFYRIRLVPQSP